MRPELVEDLLGTIVAKAENTQQRLVELLSIPADLRVLRAVLLLAGMDRPDAAIPLTQNDLANFAATTRPTANRVLREEAKRGTLQLSFRKLRSRVTDHSPQPEIGKFLPLNSCGRRLQQLCHGPERRDHAGREIARLRLHGADLVTLSQREVKPIEATAAILFQ